MQAQEVISTQGDSYSGAAGSIDYTIGEPVINTVSDGTNDLTQGFHQTTWNFVGLDDYQPDYSAKVYPNPIESQLQIETANYQGVSYDFFDERGRLISSDQLTSELTSIEVEKLTPGSYNLRLKDSNGNALKIFKLIKHN